jgi:C4-dicarboxylate-specific signal transduction histidine kinase
MTKAGIVHRPLYRVEANDAGVSEAQPAIVPRSRPRRRSADPFGASGFLAGMRIRKKLIVLHTGFSLLLVALLIVVLQPPLQRMIEQSEQHEAELAVKLMAAGGGGSAVLATPLPPGVRLIPASDPAIRPEDLQRARAEPGRVVLSTLASETTVAMLALPSPAAGGPVPAVEVIGVAVRLEEARQSVVNLYVLVILALLAVYALIAAALELFVLPRHVYMPIGEILRADRAVLDNRHEEELVDERLIPADELGAIMRSRNATVSTMRRHEAALAQAAEDLKRKNHLLETVRRNLADADRLASLGVMSAGLAHEMNTPLAVVKGLAEKVARGQPLGDSESELMLRVVGRLEKLSESLLDFARVRPPAMAVGSVREMVEEAWMLVRLDRQATRDITLHNTVREGTTVRCDPDRIVQVLVNLLRNAADAMLDPPAAFEQRGLPTLAVERAIFVTAEIERRGDRPWMVVRVYDRGPGLDQAIVERLFEPFASTKLDARGTGLGLAVSEGIAREHGGTLTARNIAEQDRAVVGQPCERPTGAVFELTLPA